MKVILILAVCALAAASPKVAKPHPIELNAVANNTEDRNWIIDQVVNALIRQLIEYVKRVFTDGSALLGIPPLDPLDLEHFHLYFPTGIINLDLDLKNVYVTGASGFEVQRSHFDLRELSLDLDITVPAVDISAEKYDLIGDLFTAIPLFGTGRAIFKVDSLRFRGKVFLKQSENEKSVIISHIENTAFILPYFRSKLTGVIGGGDIDVVVNAVIEEVIVDYVNRFQGSIARIIARILPRVLNPLLEQLDTWKYIANLV